MKAKQAGLFSMFLSVIFATAGFAVLFYSNTSVSAKVLRQKDAFSDTACLDCHTDQAKLEELTANDAADEPEEASLSSGPG